MTIFNLQGSALFGPGSEWFWAMAQFILVAVTLVGIYLQLRAQGGSNAIARIETFEGRSQAKEMQIAKLKTAIELRYGQQATEMNSRMAFVCNFYEILGDQHQAGFMGLAELDSRFGGGTQIWWRILRPTIEATRMLEGEPALYEGFEKLDRLCGARAAKNGSPRTYFLETPMPQLLDMMIQRTTDQLQLVIDAQSDVIPRPPAGAALGEA